MDGRLTKKIVFLAAGLLLLAACSPAAPAPAPTAVVPTPVPIQPTAAAPSDTATAAPTEIPPTLTLSPSLTPTPPFSPTVMQALNDAFSCLERNLTYMPNIVLTQFCPGYWSASGANINSLDGHLIRAELEAALTSMDAIRWRLEGVSDVQLDENLSTTTNPIYTATLATTFSASGTLTCPGGTPAPFQTTVSIPIQGTARIAVYDYTNAPQEIIQIESWNVTGNPVQEYCAALH